MMSYYLKGCFFLIIVRTSVANWREAAKLPPLVDVSILYRKL